MPFYEAGRQSGGSFDAGIEQLLAAVLVSPDFLYRSISPPEAPDQPDAYPSMISSSLQPLVLFWGTLPDTRLLDLAIEGRLSEPGVVEAEAQRMLSDSRAESLVTVFALRWLNVDDLTAVEPDAAIFPASARSCAMTSRPR